MTTTGGFVCSDGYPCHNAGDRAPGDLSRGGERPPDHLLVSATQDHRQRVRDAAIREHGPRLRQGEGLTMISIDWLIE